MQGPLKAFHDRLGTIVQGQNGGEETPVTTRHLKRAMILVRTGELFLLKRLFHGQGLQEQQLGSGVAGVILKPGEALVTQFADCKAESTVK